MYYIIEENYLEHSAMVFFMGKSSDVLCVICKGSRRLCGARVCPMLMKKILKREVQSLSKRRLGGYSEWFLVGEFGYPKVSLGPISAINSIPWEPEKWAEEKLDFSQILDLRIRSLYPFQQRIVKRPPSIEEPLGETIISLDPVEVEIILKKEPKIQLRLDFDIPPFGGSAPLERLELATNSRIPRKVESIITDRVCASYAVSYLREHGISVYYLQKIFSAGFLGIAERRRLVPTRWAITAVDSIIGNSALSRIRHSPSFPKIHLFHWEYLGNKYYIFIIPNDYWAMEMFEIWLPSSIWLKGIGRPVTFHIYESYDGKPTRMDGGYYAIRTSVLEWLKKQNRIAAVLAIRIITPQYIAPVGNWQIRESIRLALDSGPLFLGDLSECVDFVVSREPILTEINIKGKSWLLKQLNTPSLKKWLS
ncbi:MAG: hypothetical protein QW819_04050 [Candidatus Korarchaeota archaeon]